MYAVKNKSVTLLCLLDDVGHPDVHAYTWYVNDTFLDDTIANNYTIDNISMETQVRAFPVPCPNPLMFESLSEIGSALADAADAAPSFEYEIVGSYFKSRRLRDRRR